MEVAWRSPPRLRTRGRLVGLEAKTRARSSRPQSFLSPFTPITRGDGRFFGCDVTILPFSLASAAFHYFSCQVLSLLLFPKFLPGGSLPEDATSSKCLTCGISRREYIQILHFPPHPCSPFFFFFFPFVSPLIRFLIFESRGPAVSNS
ncbi:hypothetical protein VTO42DRAFT_2138 [Malbranchea cinnamomea]